MVNMLDKLNVTLKGKPILEVKYKWWALPALYIMDYTGVQIIPVGWCYDLVPITETMEA